MPKSFRIGVGVGSVLFSSLWVFFSRGNEVYAGVRSLAGRLKLSIHASGVCQVALTRQHWEGITDKVDLEDRFLTRWKRFPPDDGPREVISVSFPRDFQVPRNGGVPAKAVTLLPVVPMGKSTRLRVFETFLPPEKCENGLRAFGQPLGYFALPDGRSILLTAGTEDFEPQSLERVRFGRGRLSLLDPKAAPKRGETLRGLSAISWTEPKGGVVQFVDVHGLALRRDN